MYTILPLYYAMGGVALAALLITYWIVNSRFGLRLLAIRENEVAAEAMGVNTAGLKLYAFLISAMLPGIAGGIYARYVTHIEPLGTFPLLTTITMIVMCLFGGRGTVFGPILGATLLSIFQEMVWARFLFFHEALFGAIIVFVILLMPRGILGVLQQHYRLPRTI